VFSTFGVSAFASVVLAVPLLPFVSLLLLLLGLRLPRPWGPGGLRFAVGGWRGRGRADRTPLHLRVWELRLRRPAVCVALAAGGRYSAR